MKSWKDYHNYKPFIICYQSRYHSYHWGTHNDFLGVIQTILDRGARGARTASDITIICMATNKDIHLPIAEQKEMSKARKKNLTIMLSQFNELCIKLGVTWEPMYEDYVKTCFSQGFMYAYIFRDKWLKAYGGPIDANVSVSVS